MKRNADKYVKVPFSKENYDKLKYIAKEECRFVCQQVGKFADEGIKQYEIIYGEIKPK